MTVTTAIQQVERLFREGLALRLADEPDIEVVCAAVDGAELLLQCNEMNPDVVVLEIDVVGWDPCRIAQRIQRAVPAARFVGIHQSPASPAQMARAKRAGLRHLVSRQERSECLVEAIRNAARSATGPLTTPPPSTVQRGLLTRREMEVLELVGAGWTSREISDRLTITYKTVENHKQRIFVKLGVQNQAHAVSTAIKEGLLRPDNLLEVATGA
jgi:DNA-binding NarL/FixJ family response regulator